MPRAIQRALTLTALLALCMLAPGCAYLGKFAFWRGDETPVATEPAPPADETGRYALSGDLMLVRTLAAHGGLNAYREFSGVEFEVVGWPFSTRAPLRERHTVDLYRRRVRIEGEDYTAGFDGTSAWITPRIDALGGPPRLHVLNPFFFFGLPFIFADPGIEREHIGTRTLGRVTYDAVRYTVESSATEAFEDDYIALYDRETHILVLVRYTVTYPGYMLGAGENETTQRHAVLYDQWQWVEGILVPRKALFYIWEDADDPTQDGVLTGPPALTYFDEVTLSAEPPDPGLFTKPPGAIVDAPPAPLEAR